MSDDTVTMTRWQLTKEREHAVMAAKIESHEKIMPEVFASIKSINVQISKIPLEMVSYREEMEKDIKQYLHDGFITANDLQKFEVRMEKRVSGDMEKVTQLMNQVMSRVNRMAWIISGAMLAGAVIFWILTNTNIKIIA